MLVSRGYCATQPLDVRNWIVIAVSLKKPRKRFHYAPGRSHSRRRTATFLFPCWLKISKLENSLRAAPIKEIHLQRYSVEKKKHSRPSSWEFFQRTDQIQLGVGFRRHFVRNSFFFSFFLVISSLTSNFLSCTDYSFICNNAYIFMHCKMYFIRSLSYQFNIEILKHLIIQLFIHFLNHPSLLSFC